jgi:polyphosphate glucokinase
MATTASALSRSPGPHTLVFDIGGTGLKATVLDADGRPEHDRVRMATTYPCPPAKLLADLSALARPLSAFERLSAGFPGVIRDGRVVTAPHFVTKHGPGSPVDRALVAGWAGFDLADALAASFGVPARVANDADVQGAGVVSGHGLELMLTLGTGLGSAVFRNGRLAVHLELAHHPTATGATYDDYVGDAARKAVGTKRWNRRLRKALAAIDALIVPDTVFLGGGNAERVDLDTFRKLPELAAKIRVAGNEGGLLGGIRLWEDVSLA